MATPIQGEGHDFGMGHQPTLIHHSRQRRIMPSHLYKREGAAEHKHGGEEEKKRAEEEKIRKRQKKEGSQLRREGEEEACCRWVFFRVSFFLFMASEGLYRLYLFISQSIKWLALGFDLGPLLYLYSCFLCPG